MARVKSSRILSSGTALTGSRHAHREGIREVLFFSVVGRNRPQAADFKRADFAEQLLQVRQGDFHFEGQLRLAGIATQIQTQLVVRFLEAPRLAAEVARAPVHFAQAVEDRAANPELGIRTEQYVFALV